MAILVNRGALIYTRYSGVAADEEQKKKDLGVYVSNFKTYTKYLKLLMKSKIQKSHGGQLHF